MIILKHLTVERFRLLREIDLHFPQRGSILIQGANEAGKSTLFESIYFALYGEPLAADRGKRPLDDLILYGEQTARVMLSLSIGATELTITRTLQRGRPPQVSLHVHRLGLPEEAPITLWETAKRRIIDEMGRLDGEALRNSCFVEQKGLGRLEQLSGHARETALRQLLGLEKLTTLGERFSLTPADEQQLVESRERLNLAEMQARIPELSAKLGEVEAALDAVLVNEKLAEITLQETEIAEQEGSLETIKVKRGDLKSRQVRVQQLKKAEQVLSEIITAYDEMAEARRELPELDRQIGELERREREELPYLERRVHDLEDLTHTFGTLERMANDLLAAVSTIKELEQEVKEQTAFQESLGDLEKQITQASGRVEQSHQAQRELEERRRSGRPTLEERLRRLKVLGERLQSLRNVEERYVRRLSLQEQAESASTQIEASRQELRDAEQRLTQLKAQSSQIQLQVDEREKRWRQLGLAQQLGEWLRFKDLTQGLSEAEQNVHAAYRHESRMREQLDSARSIELRNLIFMGAAIALFLGLLVMAVVWGVSQQFVLTIVALVLAAVSAVACVFTAMQYLKSRNKKQVAQAQEDEAMQRVTQSIGARESSARVGGGLEALGRIEQEIRALGAVIPGSIEEARQLINQIPDRQENINDAQKRAVEAREPLAAARNRVSAAQDASNMLRKKIAEQEARVVKEGWDDIQNRLRTDKLDVEQARAEIATLMGQEGLPIPTFDPTSFNAEPKFAELQTIIDEAIRTAERELASLDGKADMIADLQVQLRGYQDDLKILLARKEVVMNRQERFQTQDPTQQLERAREQQAALRDALRSLQDSLRLRVKPLGVAFGQAAISSAENAGRKELEALHIALGRRLELQEQRERYATTLKERQLSLSGHYQQLAKYSSTLGSWIVPPNPFAETLNGLRARCQQEMKDAREESFTQETESLSAQEGASKAKIALCHEEIEECQESIASLLAQRARPRSKGYLRNEIVAVWPLVSEYSATDRQRLEREHAEIEQELHTHEQQELELGKRLRTEGTRLELEVARQQMDEQERAYQTKKRGNLLIEAVVDRLMRKMIPRTEYHMQQVLPLLTSGRYHDVQLVTEAEEGSASGGPLQLRVWDPAAGDYLPKSALSGGAADQISLALRLAFAIAALPRELGAAPGFLLLDEPLSSFDRSRTQALIDVVTGEMLGQHYEQILFISHSGAFDPALFPYHIQIDGGQIVESNLPVVPRLSLSEGEGFDPTRVPETPGRGQGSAESAPVAVES